VFIGLLKIVLLALLPSVPFSPPEMEWEHADIDDADKFLVL